MKKIIFSLVALFLIFSFSLATASKAEALQRVGGYTKKSGTYVAPHYKSSPNKSKFDNFSAKGNINPFTGKKGTVNPFKITPKKYKY
ncbi:MAG: hypothetical protein G01um10145_446 [Microgenomates group bacterium Gr01-1014_5]|nr:MAG: hypothetical protein G01um10145_446 [Microgenomates group bacterium Gr01-1014_5]